jgi:hypothetical protein
MSLRIRFRFDGRCSMHPRYSPEREGRPQNKECPGCESLYVIHLYCRIARKKAESGEGILISNPQTHTQPASAEQDGGAPGEEERGESADDGSSIP